MIYVRLQYCKCLANHVRGVRGVRGQKGKMQKIVKWAYMLTMWFQLGSYFLLNAELLPIC